MLAPVVVVFVVVAWPRALRAELAVAPVGVATRVPAAVRRGAVALDREAAVVAWLAAPVPPPPPPAGRTIVVAAEASELSLRRRVGCVRLAGRDGGAVDEGGARVAAVVAAGFLLFCVDAARVPVPVPAVPAARPEAGLCPAAVVFWVRALSTSSVRVLATVFSGEAGRLLTLFWTAGGKTCLAGDIWRKGDCWKVRELVLLLDLGERILLDSSWAGA